MGESGKKQVKEIGDNVASKVKAKAKNKSIVIDTGLIRRELEATFATPGTKRKVTEIEKIAEQTANDVISELNKRSSMRENQGAGSPYFERTDVNRAVKNKPFENATVAVRSATTTGVKISLSAPVIPTKSNGRPVDIFDILENGRDKIVSSKKMVFPATRDGAERLIKKRLTGVRSVKKIFRAQSARYKKRNGKIVLIFTNEIKKVEGRGILGVIARDIEDRLVKKEITLKTLGIKGKIGKGKIKVKVQ